MDVIDLVKTRYTTKHYDPSKRISDEDFAKLLEVLRLSPTAVNIQPWQFFIASTDEAKQKILPAVFDFNRERVADASHVLVFAVQEKIDSDYLDRLFACELADHRWDEFEDKTGLDAGRRNFVKMRCTSPEETLSWEARQSYIALGFLLFAAAQMGIDSTCLEGIDMEKMDEILGFKEKGLRTVIAVSLGYRLDGDKNAGRPKSRWPASEIFHEIR